MSKVYLALPCYNPTDDQWQRVIEFHKTLKNYSQFNLSFDVAVIDDGSPYWVAPPSSMSEEISVLRFPVNRGKGGALKAAIQQIKKEYAIFAFIDFDLPYSTEDLVRACLWINFGLDIAIGDRACWWKTSDSGKLSRNLAHRFFRLFIRTLVIGGLHDTQCGVKAFKFHAARLIAEKAQLAGFLFDVEWLYIAARHRLSIQNIAVKSQEHHSPNNFLSFMNGKLLLEFWRLIVAIRKRSYDSAEIVNWKKTELPF